MNGSELIVKYTMAKGFINGRDSVGCSIYGAFLGVSTADRLLYLGEIFSYAPIENDASWADLLVLIEGTDREAADDALAHYANELHEFIDIHGLLERGKRVLDTKETERKISYFFSDILNVNAVTFLELTTVEEGELYTLMPSLRASGAPGETAEESEPEEARALEQAAGSDEIFIRCEPVLDPVAGIAVNDLKIGNVVACKIPEDSSFYKFLKNSHPGFDGVIAGEITGVQLNEYGTAVVALHLSDGVAGALKLSGKVRVKMIGETAASPDAAGRFSAEIVAACVAVALFLVIMGVLLYLLT